MKLFNITFFLVLAFFCTPMLWSANTRLTILRPTGTVTHNWKYMPSNEDVIQQGLKGKQYALKKLPEETYLQSELIDVDGCDMAMSVRYYVSTKNTHPIKFELVDEKGDVIYSYVNDNPELNESTMTIGDKTDVGVLDGVKKVSIRLSLSDAYSEMEVINIDEFELYSKNGAGITNAIVAPIQFLIEPQTLVINSVKNIEAEFYSLSGVLVKNNAICVGTNRIDLTSGFYLVKIERDIYKIIIP